MTIWLDGLSVVASRPWAVGGIILLILWGAALFHGVLTKVFKDKLTPAEYLSLSLSGWVIPVLLWVCFYWFVTFLLGRDIGLGLSVLLALMMVFWVKPRVRKISIPSIFLLLFFIASIILRLAWVDRALLPSYFDSAEHYLIIQTLLEGRVIGSGGNYYHLGYHLLTAALVELFHLRIADAMLVFGQIVLALLPAPLFIIIRRETNSDAAGMFAVLAVGFGFHMPAHLVNWGKYPALLGLFFLSLFFSLLYLAVRCQEQRSVLARLLIPVALISTVVHTRLWIVYLITAFAFLVVRLSLRFSARSQRWFFITGAIVLTLLIFFTVQTPMLKALGTGYWLNDVWMLGLALVFFFFATYHHRIFTFLLVIILCLTFLGPFFPVDVPPYGKLALLDRPFAQALVLFPLALIFGLGYAGLTGWLRRLNPTVNLPARLMAFSLFGLVLWNAGLHHNFYPSECCRFADRDDLAALAWISANLPKDETILIASSLLRVSPFSTDQPLTGSDAGVWILPLTDRTVRLFPYRSQFSQPDVHARVCTADAEYMYVGGMPQSFDISQLTARPEWYRDVFALPGARVIQVLGCE